MDGVKLPLAPRWRLPARNAGDPCGPAALLTPWALLYEDVTEHLGFLRSSDEYKVMALASYGEPRHLPFLRDAVAADGAGGFRIEPFALDALCKRRDPPTEEFDATHADLADPCRSVSRRS